MAYVEGNDTKMRERIPLQLRMPQKYVSASFDGYVARNDTDFTIDYWRKKTFVLINPWFDERDEVGNRRSFLS